jgi:hypothetical protein
VTTLACNRREMACDSRTSYGDGEFTVCDDKIERIGDSLIGCAGNVESIFKFLSWFKNQERERPEFSESDSFSAIVLNKRGMYWFCNTTYPSKVCEPFFALGSGSMAAKAAMLCGKTPTEAVGIAIKCDKNSGGPVRTFTLE